jgi:histidyl-tRNA synthetase
MAKVRKTIKPELLGGFKDYLPEVMISRQEILDSIRKTFESFGFLPLDTPCLERSSVLGTDKDEFKMEVYRFSDNFDGSGQDVTLRFDLTVPLSRVIAAYPKLQKPFKRYQRGPVWRKESPQAGRFREFVQFDADIVGSDSILSDSEIILLMNETLVNLGIENFVIRFNNRKILNGLPKAAGFNDKKAPEVFRVLDKLDKIGLEAVCKELGRKPENEFDDIALDLSDQSISKIKQFLDISGDAKNLMPKLKQFFRGVEIAQEGISECEQIVTYISALNVPRKNWKFDLSVARGLGYYTGPVFETTLTDLPEIGSVFSGGRYDDLVARYTGEKIPAVGASVGVDRLIAALEKLGKILNKRATSSAMLTMLDDGLAMKILKLSEKLREANVNNEIYLGRGILRDQIIYAAKREIPYVVILGEEEDRLGKVKLKDMVERKEELLTEEGLITRLSKASSLG